MFLALPVSFLLVQLALTLFLPADSAVVSYVVMIVAPLLAAAAALWRGWREVAPARGGWFLVAAAVATWATGAFLNLWHELVLGQANEMYRDSMLAFNLAAVPLTFLLAREWLPTGRWLVRSIDALLALALGFAYFLFTWAMLTGHDPANETSVINMVWLFDAQNVFIAVGALFRWRAADEPAERQLFRSLVGYAVAYTVIVFGNNHIAAGDPAFGPEIGSLICIAFALLAGFALHQRVEDAAPRPAAGLVHAVRIASPLVLAGALLLVSLFLIRVSYFFGVAGVLLAVLGHSLRSILSQVRDVERGDRLQRDRTDLQAMAWTDALTGVANRRFLDHALSGAGRRESAASQPLSVLMIDIDHFKQLNDRQGHPAGDACLREVAQALRQALVRPGDVLARYGGEEFIALLQEADSAGALVVAERLRAAVEALRIEHIDSPVGVVTVSIGAASAASQGVAIAPNLVATADRALYEAKCAGRNQVRSLIVAGV